MNSSTLDTSAAAPRLNYASAAPATLQAMRALQQAANHTGLEPALLELVKLRVSQINGCAFCIHMHFRDAVKAGETPARLYLLDAWTETDLYSPRERAALRLVVAKNHVELSKALKNEYANLKVLHPRLKELSTSWKKRGIWGVGWRLTLKTSACPSTGSGCSLSQALDPIVHTKSLLTAANCSGILRRERRAGRALDPIFEQALEETIRLWSNVAEASGLPERAAFAPRFVPKLADIKAAIPTGRFSVARNLTWNECERLMGFPPGWTAVEGASLATRSRRR